MSRWGNDPSGGCGTLAGQYCDAVGGVGNEQIYKANVNIPLKSDFGVARLDHDFGSKWHFNISYRVFRLTKAVTSQVDIGGFFAGDTKGNPRFSRQSPAGPVFPRGRPDDKHHQQRHQRLPLELHPQLLVLVRQECSSASCRTGRRP